MRKFPFSYFTYNFSEFNCTELQEYSCTWKSLFYRFSLSYIFPIDPDSIKFENGDSVIYHFKSVRPPRYIDTLDYEAYYNPKGASWAGEKTILKPDNSTIWFAHNGDSILIRNDAKMNDIWLVNRKRNTYGKTTGHVLKSFMNITDSVKIIAIGTVDTITTEITGKEFWLSKNYGFIKMNDIYNFYQKELFKYPYSDYFQYPYTGPISSLSLFGSNLFPATKTKLTEKMINDFDIGDEFHKNGLVDKCTSVVSNYENIAIISKAVNSLTDTVVYTAITCGYSNNAFSKVSYNQKKIIKLPYRDIGYIPLKVSFNKDYNQSINYPVTLHVEAGLLWEGHYSGDNCGGLVNDSLISYSCPVERLESDITCGGFIIEGTGNGYNSYFNFDPDGGYYGCYTNGKYCLNYFKKGSVTWGTPNNFNCDTLTARTILGINETNLQKSIKVHPNPFSESLTIKSDDRIQTVNIYNLQMQLIKAVQSINSQEVILNFNELLSGLYIAEVILTDHRKSQYKIIKSD